MLPHVNQRDTEKECGKKNSTEEKDNRFNKLELDIKKTSLMQRRRKNTNTKVIQLEHQRRKGEAWRLKKMKMKADVLRMTAG